MSSQDQTRETQAASILPAAWVLLLVGEHSDMRSKLQAISGRPQRYISCLRKYLQTEIFRCDIRGWISTATCQPMPQYNPRREDYPHMSYLADMIDHNSLTPSPSVVRLTFNARFRRNTKSPYAPTGLQSPITQADSFFTVETLCGSDRFLDLLKDSTTYTAN